MDHHFSNIEIGMQYVLIGTAFVEGRLLHVTNIGREDRNEYRLLGTLGNNFGMMWVPDSGGSVVLHNRVLTGNGMGATATIASGSSFSVSLTMV